MSDFGIEREYFGLERDYIHPLHRDSYFEHYREKEEKLRRLKEIKKNTKKYYAPIYSSYEDNQGQEVGPYYISQDGSYIYSYDQNGELIYYEQFEEHPNAQDDFRYEIHPYEPICVYYNQEKWQDDIEYADEYWYDEYYDQNYVQTEGDENFFF